MHIASVRVVNNELRGQSFGGFSWGVSGTGAYATEIKSIQLHDSIKDLALMIK